MSGTVAPMTAQMPTAAPATTAGQSGQAPDAKREELLRALLMRQMQGSQQQPVGSAAGAAMNMGASALNAYSMSKLFGR